MGCEQACEPGWNPTFTVHGNVCQRIGSLLPAEGNQSQYMQVYFYDQALEVRRNIFADLEPAVLQQLQDMLHATNVYVRGLRSAIELLPPEQEDIKIVFSAR